MFDIDDARAAYPYFKKLHDAIMAANPKPTYFAFAVNQEFTFATIGIEFEEGCMLQMRQGITDYSKIPLGYNGVVDWLAHRVSIAIASMGT